MSKLSLKPLHIPSFPPNPDAAPTTYSAATGGAPVSRDRREAWLRACRHRALPLDRIAGLDLRDSELAQHIDHGLPASHADGEDVRDHAAEAEADRRRAQRIDEHVIPRVAVADAPDERGELGLHRRQAGLLPGDGSIAFVREIAAGDRRGPHLLGEHEAIEHRADVGLGALEG